MIQESGWRGRVREINVEITRRKSIVVLHWKYPLIISPNKGKENARFNFFFSFNVVHIIETIWRKHVPSNSSKVNLLLIEIQDWEPQYAVEGKINGAECAPLSAD